MRSEQAERELKEKSKWVRAILEKIGLSTSDWPEFLPMEDIRRIRSELKELSIDIIDDSDNGIEIYFEEQLIAEWRRPRYVLRENPRERDPKYRYYLEMHLNCRDVYSENESKELT